jgi:hypothetical protein
MTVSSYELHQLERSLFKARLLHKPVYCTNRTDSCHKVLHTLCQHLNTINIISTSDINLRFDDIVKSSATLCRCRVDFL